MILMSPGTRPRCADAGKISLWHRDFGGYPQRGADGPCRPRSPPATRPRTAKAFLARPGRLLTDVCRIMLTAFAALAVAHPASACSRCAKCRQLGCVTQTFYYLAPRCLFSPAFPGLRAPISARGAQFAHAGWPLAQWWIALYVTALAWPWVYGRVHQADRDAEPCATRRGSRGRGNRRRPESCPFTSRAAACPNWDVPPPGGSSCWRLPHAAKDGWQADTRSQLSARAQPANGFA
jgi:hypothetical protein